MAEKVQEGGKQTTFFFSFARQESSLKNSICCCYGAVLSAWQWNPNLFWSIKFYQLLKIPINTLKFNPYPTAFPYGNGMVLHFYQQQESSTTKTVHKVINKGLKTYV